MKLFIKEDLSPSIPNWLKNAIRRTRGYKGKMGPAGTPEFKYRNVFGEVKNLDLETTEYHELPLPRNSREFNQIMNSEDKVAVMHGKDDRGFDFVYAARANNPSIFINGKMRYAEDVPVKYLLNMITDFGYLDVSSDVIDKRSERKSNPPSGRNRSSAGSYGFDKSGYEKTGLKKYMDMLADLGLGQYESILEDGFNTYDTLNSMLRKFRNDPDKILEVNNLTSNFLQTLRNIQVNYNDIQQDTGDPEVDARISKYAKNRTKPYILQMKQQIKDMKNFLDNEIMY